MNRLITSKPTDDTKLTFAKMGQKPGIDVVSKKSVKKVAKKSKKSKKVNRFAQKAAMALANKG